MYLLDTHTFVWWVLDDLKLPRQIRAILENPEHEIFLSAASIWEIFIKKNSGKLNVPKDLEERIEKLGFRKLNISFEHAKIAGLLPKHHTDPFDRMLIAQAMLENLKLITTDKHFKAYDVSLVTF